MNESERGRGLLVVVLCVSGANDKWGHVWGVCDTASNFMRHVLVKFDG